MHICCYECQWADFSRNLKVVKNVRDATTATTASHWTDWVTLLLNHDVSSKGA